MRKWCSIFVAICLVMLLGTGSIAGKSIANNAKAGEICEDGSFLSQVVRCAGKDYVIYKSAEQTKFQVVKTGQDLYQYETVGTLHADRVYYVYGFVNETKQCWGLEPVSREKDETWQVPVIAAEGTLLAAGSAESEIYISILGNDGRTITEYALSLNNGVGEWRENVVFSLPEGHFAVCGAYQAQNLVLAMDDGTVYVRDVVVREVEEAPQDTLLAKCFADNIITGAEGIWSKNCSKEAMVQYLIPVILVSAFLVLLIAGRKQSEMVYHLIFCSEIICMLGLLLAGYIFAGRLTKQEIMETGIETGYVLEDMKAGQRADGTVDMSGYWKIVKHYEDLIEDIIIVDPSSNEVIQAKTLTRGMIVSEVLDKELETLIQQTADGNKTTMKQFGKGTKEYVVASRDFTQIDAKSLLLAIISAEGIEKRIESAVSTIWNVIFLLMAVVTILHMLIFLFFTAKWKKFLEGMQYVAYEKQAYADRPVTEDGLRSAWAPLDRIGHNIVKLRYERDLMYKNYYRFVPKGMDSLLGKPEMADIEIGDNNTINGCMVQFQMENIKDVSGRRYMDMMTDSMELMHQIREKHGGIFISAGGDLLNRKVFFESDPKEALLFAIELYQAHAVKEKLADTNFIMILHQDDYIYGISGVEDMMTPFIYCEEEKILDAHRDALSESKLRIVVTEQTRNSVGSGFSMRYIGFVSGGTMTGSIKLYECLDAYGEEKRKIMMESDSYFQKALKLFYSDDFYLARNAFNEVLKMNEQDEIARWYLFHCEYHLNKPEAEVTYGLFENTVWEQKS